MSQCIPTILLLSLAMLTSSACSAVAQSPVFGRWDLTATQGGTRWPMWLELTSGPTGRLQLRDGHALPLVGVLVQGNKVSFTMPTEKPTPTGQEFTAIATGDSLTGVITDRAGARITVTGQRAPTLVRSRAPDWGQPIDLLARGLSGWHVRTPGLTNGWTYLNGELTNAPPSIDLITGRTFTDFRLHVEVNVPKGGNSGIYLRGRYEVQVQDDYGKAPGNQLMGGIYGQVQPVSLPAKPAGEWQTFDITLIGRRVTVVLNGVTIIDNAEIPGITGGALDSDEGAPGPLMLQGDHSGVRYRNIRISPAK
jgi:hypothetical protein